MPVEDIIENVSYTQLEIPQQRSFTLPRIGDLLYSPEEIEKLIQDGVDVIHSGSLRLSDIGVIENDDGSFNVSYEFEVLPVNNEDSTQEY